jgi:uncharacterized protein YkvS
MTPEQCAAALRVFVIEYEADQYLRDVLTQTAAYLSEIPELLDMLDKAIEQLNRTKVVVDNATAEIQRLNLELTYARSRP